MAIARFLVDTTVATRLGGDFPLGTLAVNLSGAVVLGVLAGAALSGTAYTVIAGGGVGTYTTFSTWMFESHRAGEAGDARVLWANIAVSLIAGLAAVALGHWIGGAL
jgi:CrcB protein